MTRWQDVNFFPWKIESKRIFSFTMNQKGKTLERGESGADVSKKQMNKQLRRFIGREKSP